MFADPPSPQGVIGAYEAMLQQTHRMLEAAHRQEWETLIAYQAEYLAQTERLQQLDEVVPLTETLRQRKADLIEQILDNNLHLRDHLTMRREELGELIDTSRQQRNLSRAYGVPAGGHHSRVDSQPSNDKSL